MTEELDATQQESSPDSQNSPGLILKRCREYHEISLDEAAEATKIGKNYLRSLEGDQVQDFANIAYLKGFVRIYSAYLGLNQDDVLRMYEKLYGSTQQADTAASLTAAEDQMKRKGIRWQRYALPLILLGAIIVLSNIIGRRPVHPPRPAEVQKPSLPPRTTATMPSVALASRTSAAGVATTSPSQAPPPSQTPEIVATQQPLQQEGFVLRLKAVKDGKLNITLDESLTQDYMLTSGDIIEWKALRTIGMDLSDPAGADLELNGRPLRTNVPPGKKAYLNVGPNGIIP